VIQLGIFSISPEVVESAADMLRQEINASSKNTFSRRLLNHSMYSTPEYPRIIGALYKCLNWFYE
jgi:hypothetical protein